MNSEALRVLSTSFHVGWDPSEYEVRVAEDTGDDFARLVKYLQLPSKDRQEDQLVDKFLAGNGLVQVMLSGYYDKKTCHQLINLHDLWANALLQSSVLLLTHFVSQ